MKWEWASGPLRPTGFPLIRAPVSPPTHMNTSRFGLVVSAVVACATMPASRAWDKPTHAITASIAYEELKASHPAILAKVVQILKNSEDYSQKLNWQQTIASAGEPEDVVLFQLAARWPDDIKADNSGRDRGTHGWHYVNLPTGPDGRGHEPGTPNLLTEFPKKQQAWLHAQTDAERAVLLCWYLHLIGDSHQPLHSSAFFRRDAFPDGDAGGNLWTIRTVKGLPDAKNLHSLWDDLVFVGGDPAREAKDILATADTLRAKHPRSEFQSQLTSHPTLESWVRAETFPRAVDTAYKDGRKWLAVPTEGSTQLSERYVTKARDLAEKQVALAGYRIADLLVVLLK